MAYEKEWIWSATRRRLRSLVALDNAQAWRASATRRRTHAARKPNVMQCDVRANENPICASDHFASRARCNYLPCRLTRYKINVTIEAFRGCASLLDRSGPTIGSAHANAPSTALQNIAAQVDKTAGGNDLLMIWPIPRSTAHTVCAARK